MSELCEKEGAVHLRITSLTPEGEEPILPATRLSVLARIYRPLDGRTVCTNFTASGTYQNINSTLTVRIDGNGFTQSPTVNQDPATRTWFADFSGVPDGTDYALSVTADLEVGETISISVSAAVCKITYRRRKFELVSITNPDISVTVRKGCNAASTSSRTSAVSRKRELVVNSPFIASVGFCPAVAQVRGCAVNRASEKSYEACTEKSLDSSPFGIKTQTWDFLFELPPGQYALIFTGDNVTAETEIRVDPEESDYACASGPHRWESREGARLGS